MLTREHVIRLMRECLDDLNAERQRGSTIEFSEGLAFLLEWALPLIPWSLCRSQSGSKSERGGMLVRGP